MRGKGEGGGGRGAHLSEVRCTGGTLEGRSSDADLYLMVGL